MLESQISWKLDVLRWHCQNLVGRAGREEQGAHMNFGEKKTTGNSGSISLAWYFFWGHYNKVFQILLLKIKYVFGVNNIFAGKGNTQTRSLGVISVRSKAPLCCSLSLGPQASPPSKPSFSSDGDYDLSLWPLPPRGLCGMTAEKPLIIDKCYAKTCYYYSPTSSIRVVFLEVCVIPLPPTLPGECIMACSSLSGIVNFKDKLLCPHLRLPKPGPSLSLLPYPHLPIRSVFWCAGLDWMQASYGQNLLVSVVRCFVPLSATGLAGSRQSANIVQWRNGTQTPRTC